MRTCCLNPKRRMSFLGCGLFSPYLLLSVVSATVSVTEVSVKLDMKNLAFDKVFTMNYFFDVIYLYLAALFRFFYDFNPT